MSFNDLSLKHKRCRPEILLRLSAMFDGEQRAEASILRRTS